MDEGRKRVLLIAASILAARKLAQYEGGARVPATISAIGDAVRWAERILRHSSREAADNFAVLSFGKSLKSFSGHIALCAK
jgi:hypothetical protein